METVLAVLCGCYGVYCGTFCCSAGYTLIKEHNEKKKEKELLIKRNYQTFYLNEKKKELENFERKLSHKNVKLEPIQEEMSEADSISDEELVVSDEELIADVDENTQLCNQNYIISIRKC